MTSQSAHWGPNYWSEWWTEIRLPCPDVERRDWRERCTKAAECCCWSVRWVEKMSVTVISNRCRVLLYLVRVALKEDWIALEQSRQWGTGNRSPLSPSHLMSVKGHRSTEWNLHQLTKEQKWREEEENDRRILKWLMATVFSSITLSLQCLQWLIHWCSYSTLPFSLSLPLSTNKRRVRQINATFYAPADVQFNLSLVNVKTINQLLRSHTYHLNTLWKWTWSRMTFFLSLFLQTDFVADDDFTCIEWRASCYLRISLQRLSLSLSLFYFFPKQPV